MNIWTNTSTLDGFDDGLLFTKGKSKADVLQTLTSYLRVFPQFKENAPDNLFKFKRV